MASIPVNLTRVSGQMKSQLLLSNMQSSNLDLLRIQQQLATGKIVNRPSDAPGSVGSIISLRKSINLHDQRITNLHQAGATMDNTDEALADISDLLLEVQNIASSQVGVGSNTDTRANQAQVVQGKLSALLSIANREYQDIFLFAGRSSDAAPFVDQLNGIRYIGASEDLTGDLGIMSYLGVNTNGVDALGAVSERVESQIDLNPLATAATRLVNVNGAAGSGILRGTLTVTVDGVETQVNLTTADTLGDVVTRINAAINTLDPAAGATSIVPTGFDLTANAGHTITISDIGTSVVARDLGLDITATGGTTVGGDVNPRLTAVTEIAAIGTAVDWASGMQITNGGVTRTIDLSAAVNIQDVINAIDAEDMGIRLEINADGTGFNLFNEISGSEMSVGENGGTTAADLGLRTFDASTLLSDLNHDYGVRVADGVDDLQFTLADSSTVDVNLDGSLSVQDVLDAINAAGGGSLTASLAASGNGLVITDNTVGAAAFKVQSVNGSFALQDLGLPTDPAPGNVLNGEDVAKVRVESVFTHLMALRDGLLNDDSLAITLAGEKVQADIEMIAAVRAEVGVRSQQVSDTRQRTEGLKLQASELLSGLQDADYSQAISRFTQLQQQLQANMLSGQMVMQLSLLDFLR
jgi:flagellar hook-associated protein 3 FlgL